MAGSVNSSAGYNARATSQGNVSAVFNWVPAAGQTLQSDPASTVLTLRVYADATAHATRFNGPLSGIQMDYTIDNSFNDPRQTSRFDDLNDDSFWGEQSRGWHLLQISNPDRIQTITVPARYFSAISNVSGAENFAQATVRFQAVPDLRSLKICSPTIEDSYFKSATGTPTSDVRVTTPPATGPYPLKNKRAADGAMIVDSRATKRIITLADGSKKARWYGGGTFQAITSGFSQPSYSWDIGSNKNAATASYLTVIDDAQFNPFGPWSLKLADDRLPVNLNTIFKVNVTDTDGVVGSSTYTVKWHKPFENYRDDPSDTTLPRDGFKLWDSSVSNCQVEADAAINHPNGATVQFKTTLLGQTSDWVERGIGLARDIEYIGMPVAIADEMLDALVDVGILQDLDTGERNSIAVLNTITMFNKAMEITNNGQNDLAPVGRTYDKCRLIRPLFYVKYKVRHLIGDTYDVHGYMGQNDRIVGSDNDGTNIYGRGWTGKYEETPIIEGQG